jgi:hypothetical protein
VSAHPRPLLKHAANANEAGVLIVLDRERAETLAAEKGEGYRGVPVEVTAARATWAIEVFRQKFRPERPPEGSTRPCATTSTTSTRTPKRGTAVARGAISRRTSHPTLSPS